MPIDPHDLAAVGGLVARPDAAPLPRPWRALPAVPLHGVWPVDLPRRRMAALAAASAAAGLVAGLLGPGPAALAAPLTSAVRSTFAAPASAPAAPAAAAGALPGAPSRLGAPIDAAEPDPAPTEAAHPGSAAEAIAAVAGTLPSGLTPSLEDGPARPDRQDQAPAARPQRRTVAERDRGGPTDTRP